MRARTLLIGVLAATAAWAQTAATVEVFTPSSTLIVGQTIELRATVRSATGAVVPGAKVAWSAAPAGVVRVDAVGRATAVGLGISVVTASFLDLETEIGLQTLPLRIDISAPLGRMEEGGSYRFRAVARDLGEAPIRGAEISWEVRGLSGYETDIARIAPDGTLTAARWGRVVVQAAVPYPDSDFRFLPEFRSSIEVEIEPRRDYRLTRLLSSGERRRSRLLRGGFEGEIAANDRGEVVFLGSLDGVSGGVLLYDGAGFRLLASGASPTPRFGSVIDAFTTPSINEQGRIAVAARSDAGGAGLLLGDRDGLDYVFLEGGSLGAIEAISELTTTRASLNAGGDVLFRADFRRGGAETPVFAGLFVFAAGKLRQVWASDRPLEGGSLLASFEEFALDDRGRAYFFSDVDERRALYRVAESGEPERLAGVGDTLDGSRVVWLDHLRLDGSGEAAWRVCQNERGCFAVRFGDPGLVRLEGVNVSRVLAFDSASGAILEGEGAAGEGLYRRREANVELLWRRGAALPGGSAAEGFSAAALTASGRLLVRVRTARGGFEVIDIGAAGKRVFGDGDQAPLTANVFLKTFALIRGSRPGPPHVRLGIPLSLHAVDEYAMSARVTVGDRLPGGGIFSGAPLVVENRRGDLYFGTPTQGLFRVSAGGVELFAPETVPADDGAAVHLLPLFDVNERGAAVAVGFTDAGDLRLVSLDAGRVRTLGVVAADTTGSTASPGGGRFEQWRQLAIDERGRVMALVAVDDGPSGVFLYENGRWRATALEDVDRIDERTISFAHSLRAIDNRFVTAFVVGCCDNVFAEFRGGRWEPILTARSAGQGNQAEIVALDWIYDVNRAGEILTIAYAAVGDVILFTPAEGETKIALRPSDIGSGGIPLGQFHDVDLRDDGTFYFTAVNLRDEVTLYRADPADRPPRQNPNSPPTRSRSAGRGRLR